MECDGIYILFKTGMRISEFVGLTVSSLDMKKRRIAIDCQLQRTRKMEYVIERPKTESGNRVIPMSEDVYACFRRICKKYNAIYKTPLPEITLHVCRNDGYGVYLKLNS